MIKKSLEITPGIEPLYGTHDENLRLLEDGLHVTIDLRSDAIHVTGDQDSITRVEKVFTDFDYLRKSGLSLHNGELHGMLKLVVADPAVSLRSLVESGSYVGGDPLEAPDTGTTVRLKEGKRRVQDGPFADTKEQLGGFIIMELPSLDVALDWAARCPAASAGVVEVRPLAPAAKHRIT